MSLEESSRDQLVGALTALTAQLGEEKHDHERLLHDLQVHQLELELQNRELRDAHEALEESRNRYSDLYDFAPIAYFTFDLQGCIEEVNLTGAALIGRDRRQLKGAPFASLVELADPPGFWAHLRRCAETGSPCVTELALSAGSPPAAMQLRAMSTPVTDPAGRPIAFRTAFADITDRHRAELARNEALESERRLRRELEALDHSKTELARSLATVTEQSLGAILQVIVDQARSMVDAEYAALGIGSTRGGSFDTWVHAGLAERDAVAIGRPPRVVGLLAAVIDEARVLNVKDMQGHPSFAGFPAHHPAMTTFLGVPVRFGDRVVGNLYLANKRAPDGFSDDDAQCVESLARYAGAAMEIARLGDEAHGAIRVRDELLATVSHDLRSPLSAIAISAKLLLRMLVSVEQTTARRQAETIGRAASRMNRLIDDLLTASTLDAGRLPVATRPQPIEPIVADAVESLASVVAEASLTIDATIQPGLPDVVCDRERIHQVLANLIGNAAKFTPPGGRVTISAARYGDEVQVSVADTGPGIPEEARHDIFERYWRTGAGERGRRGVGLGLYISKGIVEIHRGRIWVESAPGTGAKITFALPAASSPRPA